MIAFLAWTWIKLCRKQGFWFLQRAIVHKTLRLYAPKFADFYAGLNPLNNGILRQFKVVFFLILRKWNKHSPVPVFSSLEIVCKYNFNWRLKGCRNLCQSLKCQFYGGWLFWQKFWGRLLWGCWHFFSVAMRRVQILPHIFLLTALLAALFSSSSVLPNSMYHSIRSLARFKIVKRLAGVPPMDLELTHYQQHIPIWEKRLKNNLIQWTKVPE